MKSLSTTDLQANGGELVHGPQRTLGPPSIDTRTLQPGDTFFCVRGPRFDAHDFVPTAVAGGAQVIVCARSASRRVVAAMGESDVTVISVPSPVQALSQLALRHRLRFAGTVIGLTGSSGKTTTKEMIAAVLETAAPTLRTAGNLNNHLGVPLTLLRLRDAHQYAVIEMGMSDRGEIRHLCELSRPQVGVITSVGAAHLETLKHVRHVADAKGELLAMLPTNGVAVIPSNVAWPWRLTRDIRAPLIAVGQRAEDDVRLTHVREGKRGAMARVHMDGEMCPLRLQMAGVHNLSNAALAVAVGRYLGVSLRDCVGALEAVAAPSMRGEVRTLSDGTAVVLDCYNANPQSMAASLAAFVKRAPQGIVVLGDMLELGELSPSAHAELGAAVANASGDLRLIAVGAYADVVAESARRAGLNAVESVPDARTAAQALAQRTPGRSILLKGSRGIGLERVYATLSMERT